MALLSTRHQSLFVLSIPIINVIADSTQGYTSAGLLSPGYLRAFVILLFFMTHFSVFFKRNKINSLILFSLIFYFILALFSSKISYSLSVFSKYMIASLMFPIGYFYFDSLDKFKKLLKVFLWVLIIYLFFIAISNIFNLGSSDYLEDSVYFGSGRVNMTKAMMILILIFPLILRNETKRRNRIFYIFIVVIAVIFVFMGVKRSAILGLAIGYIVYLYLTPYRTKLIKALVGIGVLLLLSMPLYFDTMVKRFEAREEKGRFDVEQAEDEEARVQELIAVWDEYIKGDLTYKLFGAELFNSPAYFKTARMLHTDYATMFCGSGLIGFSIFILIYFVIIKRSFYLWRVNKTDPKSRDIMAVAIALVFAALLTGISGTVTSVGLRSLTFMFWGASFSLIENELRQRKLKLHLSVQHKTLYSIPVIPLAKEIPIKLDN